MASAKSGNRDLCEYLLRKNAKINTVDDSGRNCLHYGCQFRDLCNYLAAKGGNIMQQDENGVTAVHLAAQYNHAYQV